MPRRYPLFAAVCLFAAAAAQAGDWPSFRGPNGNGIAAEKNVPTKWGSKNNVAWRVELPGPGNSSPIVSAGRVFVACAADEGKKRNLYCYDRKDGKQLWVKTVEVSNVRETHQTNPYSGSTPVANGKRVVVWHGSAGLYCYDFDGKELWSKGLGNVGHMWGYGSSPVIDGNTVFLNFGPGAETFLTAIDLTNGKQLWKKAEPGGADQQLEGRYIGTWSTPVIANVGGRKQLICMMHTRVVAYSPTTGDIIWYCDGIRGNNGDLAYTSPLISGDIGVAFGGYKGPAMAFRLGGSGNVTENQRLWWNDEGQPQRIGSGVIIGNYIFMVNAGPGTAECIELETGKQVWQKRLSGGNCWGSLCAVDGRLYVTGQNGTTTVFLPNAEKFELVAENRLNEPSNSTSAFSNGQIFLRTHKSLYCVGE